jgi:competence protein ComEC
VAVISAGRGNRFGHPHAPVLARLVEAASEVYRTDRDGTVRVSARRVGSFTVRVERGP